MMATPGPLPTYGEFLKKYPGASKAKFKQARTWITTTRAKRSAARNAAAGKQFAATAFGGYAPPGVGQFTTTARNLFPILTPAQQRAQATKSVTAATEPVIANILKQLGARETSALEGIGRATIAHQANLAQIAPAVQARFGEAKAEQAGIDQALRALPARAAEGLAAGAAELSSGMAPDVASALGRLGAGSAAESAGLGAATASRLASQGLAEQAFAAQLPAYARLEGQAAENAARGDYRRMREESIGDIRSKVPGLVEGAFQDLQNRDVQMRTGRAGVMQQGYDRMLQAAIAKAGLVQSGAELAQQGQQFSETQSWETDPNNPKNKGAAGSKSEFQKRYDTQLDLAVDMARRLRAVGRDETGTTVVKPHTPAIQAVPQMAAYWRARFPNMPEAWIQQATFRSMESAGYINVRSKWKQYQASLKGTGRGAGKGGAAGGGTTPLGPPSPNKPRSQGKKPIKRGRGYIPNLAR